MIQCYAELNDFGNNLAPIADVVSTSFDLAFSLFHLRASLVSPKKDADLTSLIKLKQEFFILIKFVLKSRLLTGNPNKVGSYAAIKILNSLLTGLDKLIYSPALANNMASLCLSVCLTDSLHNLNKKKMKLVERWMTRSEINDVEMERVKPNLETSIEMDENMCRLMEEFEEKGKSGASGGGGGGGGGEDEDGESDEDDECCVLKCFYEKVVKYFGEFVYSWETPVATLSEDNVLNQSGDNDINMITTIAVFE